MFEKVFGYILSLRKQKRMRMLEVIHKMSDSEPLLKALAYCEFYASHPLDEPTVSERLNRFVDCTVTNVDALGNELLIIGDKILEEDKSQKYYERLPTWIGDASRPVTLDEVLKVNEYSYFELAHAIKMLGDYLRRIERGITMPHNEKMSQYYLKKPGVVYREAVNVLRQLV